MSIPKHGNVLLEEIHSAQTDNFARLDGVLTSSFLGLQKTLSDLVLPLASLNNKNLKRPCTDSDTARAGG